MFLRATANSMAHFLCSFKVLTTDSAASRSGDGRGGRSATEAWGAARDGVGGKTPKSQACSVM